MGLVTLSPERATDPEIPLQERVTGQESHLQEKVIGQVIQFLGTAMQQEIHPKEKAMDLGNHPEKVMDLVKHQEKVMDQETCPERAIAVPGKVTAQGTNQEQATVPEMLLLQGELTGQGQLQGRHMAHPQHIVDRLQGEEQAPHREDLMMQGPPHQGIKTSINIINIICMILWFHKLKWAHKFEKTY